MDCDNCLHIAVCGKYQATGGHVRNCKHFVTDNNVGSKWIPVSERLPENFVSVLGYMTDAGDFPQVRECYTVGNAFYFPALFDKHPVSHWMPMPEPPKECE